jgi:magnesium and cobalt transporter
VGLGQHALEQRGLARAQKAGEDGGGDEAMGAMLERVIRMADMTAGDVMVAAPRMDLLDIDAPFDELLRLVISTAHSRFPVYQGERENIIGILMAKDLLKLQRAPELNIRACCARPFVPESKGLNDLLRDFAATATTWPS